MDHNKLYNKFVKEIEKLIQLKNVHITTNNNIFSVSLNMEDDVDRKAVVNGIVQAIQSKTEKNLYVKFENLFRFYNVMNQYKIKFNQENGKKVKQKLMNDINLKGNYKVIRKTIRIYHFFNCQKLCGIDDAYKYCQISPREFDILISEESDKTISDLDE
ncbi:12228_t:CDS:2 [Rhizophagus irregularis]|nr:12228_t:CDS:2 [Rhizophagus irregularis]